MHSFYCPGYDDIVLIIITVFHYIVIHYLIIQEPTGGWKAHYNSNFGIFSAEKPWSAYNNIKSNLLLHWILNGGG